MQKRLNILIVEDSYPIATRLKTMLEEISKVKDVRLALTISEAHQAFLEALPDVVILDISLPDGNGLDFLVWIKENHPCLYVIMFSNQADASYRLRAFQARADYFLDKSLDFEKVVPIIDQIS